MEVGYATHTRTRAQPVQSNRARPAPARRRMPLLRLLALALLILGIACRLARYFLNFPLWYDEACLALNLNDRDYAGLMRQLDNFQIAPILFLWGERAFAQLLGPSEWALRLLPLLAGVLSLLLFWHLARITVSPLAATLGVGLLAVSRWPIGLSAQVKPYSLDLLCSLALLTPAVHWLRRPERTRWLALLALLTPIAVAASFPVVFVAGGISLALLPTVRHARWTARAGYLAFNLSLSAAFLVIDVWLGSQQLGDSGSRFHDFMTGYWSNGFPPNQAGPLLEWLLRIHTGLLMAYPLGNSDWWGTGTFLFFALGAGRCWRRGRLAFVILCLAPFALNLIAACLGRYPYGGCCRLSQHLAPAICLLAGVGGAATIKRLFPRRRHRLRAACAVCGVFALLGLLYVTANLAKPYRDAEDLWSRRAVQEVFSQAAPEDQIVVFNAPEELRPVIGWYLRVQGSRLAWSGQVDWNELRDRGGRLWCLHWWDQMAPPPPDLASSVLAHGEFPLRRLAHAPYALPHPDPNFPVLRLEVSCYAPANAAPAPRIAVWP